MNFSSIIKCGRKEEMKQPYLLKVQFDVKCDSWLG
jgi:hypothetical protein